LGILQKNYLRENGSEVRTETWVAIETLVLKRIDLTKSLPKKRLQLVKEMQSLPMVVLWIILFDGFHY
jgi:hypothetical protein